MKEKIVNFWNRNKKEIKTGIVLGGTVVAMTVMIVFGFRKKVVKKYHLEEVVYIDE